MNEEYLAALTEEQLALLTGLRYGRASDSFKEAMTAVLTALADARLEAVRLKEEREATIERGTWLYVLLRDALANLRGSRGMAEIVADATERMATEMREDIRRLIEALGLMLNAAPQNIPTTKGMSLFEANRQARSVLAEMKERYDA